MTNGSQKKQQQSMLSNGRKALIGGMDKGLDDLKAEKFKHKYQDYWASSCQILCIVYDYVLLHFNRCNYCITEFDSLSQ